MHRDRYLLKPVLRFALSPLPVLYFMVRSQETFLLPSKKKGEEGKKEEEKKKSLVSTLSPTRRALCLASAPLFVINLHGVMFALADVAVGQWLARRQCGRLLRRRTGRGRVLPAARGLERCSVPGPQVASGGEALSSRICGVGLSRAAVYTQTV